MICEKDILEKNMERFDAYIERADNKANFVLALTGVLLVGIIFQSSDVIEIVNDQGLFIKVMTILILFGISLTLVMASLAALKVIMPRVPPSTKKSVFYFNDICNYSEENYKKKLKELTEEEIIGDLRRQVIQLGKICDAKMIEVKKAFKYIKISGVLLFIIIIVILVSLY